MIHRHRFLSHPLIKKHLSLSQPVELFRLHLHTHRSFLLSHLFCPSVSSCFVFLVSVHLITPTVSISRLLTLFYPADENLYWTSVAFCRAGVVNCDIHFNLPQSSAPPTHPNPLTLPLSLPLSPCIMELPARCDSAGFLMCSIGTKILITPEICTSAAFRRSDSLCSPAALPCCRGERLCRFDTNAQIPR